MEPSPSAPKKDKPELTDEYAQSLLRSINMDSAQKRAAIPPPKHFISKRMLIILVVSLVLTIVAALVTDHMTKTKTGSSTEQTTQQIINSAQTSTDQSKY
jgi:hypothetical protein